MSGLVKARLAEIHAGETPSEVSGSSVDVQFNPSTLRVQISNRTAGGSQAGAQARQRPGTGEMQVGFDLVFDTADEGTDSAGVSVLERTQMVERFVRPRGTQPGQEAPPRVLFVWGGFQVQGVMESANLDLDLFDADGTPLRAKVAVSIKGQDPRWAYTPAPPSSAPQQAGAAGAPRPGAAPLPGAGNGLAPGAAGTAGAAGAVAALVQALPGESLAQLAARAGVAPGQWRALAGGLGSGLRPDLGGGGAGSGTASSALSLSLGQEVAVPAGLGAGSGAGPSTDAAATRAALALGTQPAPGHDAGNAPLPAAARAHAADAVLAGRALTSQGGLQGAIGARAAARHGATAAQRLAAFDMPGGGAPLGARPWGEGIPLRPRRGGATPAPAPGVALTVPAAAASRWRRACGCGRPGGCGCSPR